IGRGLHATTSERHTVKREFRTHARCSNRDSLHVIRSHSMRALAIVVAIAACAGAQGPTGDFPLQVFYPDGEAGLKGKVGKRFNAKPTAHCSHDGNEARWAMTGATHDQPMPPGLTLEDGQIAGVPKQAGTYNVRVVFHGLTCASKPFPDQTV